MDLILFSIAFLVLVLAILVLTKRKQHLSDTILGIWLLLSSVEILLLTSLKYDLHYSYPDYLYFLQLFPFLHTALLYNFILSIDNSLSFKKSILSFLPFLLTLLFSIPVVIFNTPAQKLDSFLVSTTVLETSGVLSMTMEGLAYMTQFAIVLVLLSVSYRGAVRLKRQSVTSKKNVIQNWNIIWVYHIVVIYFAFWILLNLANFLVPLYDHLTLDLVRDVYTSIISFFMLIIGFQGIRKTTFFMDMPLNAKVANFWDPSYSKQVIAEDKAKIYFKKLKEYMELEKPYLSDRLSLRILADQFGISVNHLSYIINTNANMNFFNFISHYRVEEFKSRIHRKEHDQLTFTAIAYDCGFKSTSSFYDAFKRFTHLTPTQYIKEL